MTIEHVTGKDAGKIMLYALSTCVWCKKTKNLLDELGVQYDYTHVDLLQGEERKNAIAAIQKWNPAGSVPTLILNDKRSILGFKENEIREALA